VRFVRQPGCFKGTLEPAPLASRGCGFQGQPGCVAELFSIEQILCIWQAPNNIFGLICSSKAALQIFLLASYEAFSLGLSSVAVTNQHYEHDQRRSFNNANALHKVWLLAFNIKTG
jgi:hypothetical protein